MIDPENNNADPNAQGAVVAQDAFELAEFPLSEQDAIKIERIESKESNDIRE